MIVEDGAKHTLVLYNCKVPQTGEVAFTAANAKCSANLKVKGELSLQTTFFFLTIAHSPTTVLRIFFFGKSSSTQVFCFIASCSCLLGCCTLKLTPNFVHAKHVIVIYILLIMG